MLEEQVHPEYEAVSTHGERTETKPVLHQIGEDMYEGREKPPYRIEDEIH